MMSKGPKLSLEEDAVIDHRKCRSVAYADIAEVYLKTFELDGNSYNYQAVLELRDGSRPVKFNIKDLELAPQTIVQEIEMRVVEARVGGVEVIWKR